MNTMSPEKPALLVVESVEPDPQNARCMIAEICLGGYPLRVVLDFSRKEMGLIEYVEMPWMLGLHLPSQKAVVSLVDRVYSGETLHFPVDLGGQIVHADPPSFFARRGYASARSTAKPLPLFWKS